jgi:peptide/nickel transport system substrate-binding protein/oligopeptide transport system substrate-binding protein
MADGHGGVFKANDDDFTFPIEDAYLPIEPDPDQAIALLEGAGYVFEDGVLSADTPLAFEYLTNDTSAHKAIAEIMQQDFAAYGITMDIRPIEWDTFLAERKDGNYDVARNGWIADFNDPINMLEMWTTVSGNNDAQFGK